MKRVILESPYAGDVERNEQYLDRCILDCLERKEAPFASHGLYTSALDDLNPDERALGIGAGLAWSDVADYVVFYIDHGMSNGMRVALTHHKKKGKEVKFRKINKPVDNSLTDN